MKPTQLRRIYRCLIPLVILLTGLAQAGSNKTYGKIDVFSQVLHYVHNSYVEDIDDKNLLYGAIRGMLKTLDPHSTFMTPREFKSMQEDTSGHFGGVGIELKSRDGELVVVPLDDTPAARAGILAGDRIVKIDGQTTENMNVYQAGRLIKGVPGTKVVLTIDRDDFDKPKDFILIRLRIRLNPIEKSMPLPGYGLVKIRSFQERTERYLMEAIGELKVKAGGELRGLILDLRNNPGGLLDQAVRVADRFIADGVIVETKARGNRIEKDFAHKSGTEPFYPMICLVNGGSASASEIVAGALQDHGRAVILGTRSFGKGSVQTVVSLKDGSGLKLTIARYYTPKHRSIQEHGIVPDVVVPRKAPETPRNIQVTREIDLSGHLSKEGSKDFEAEFLGKMSDFQLRTALNYLRVWERFGGSKLLKAPKEKSSKKK
ncbi:MAG: S41 family peptidase [Deltaproteobacteria bacterium]|nr:S41 family peptidase [Deltaproteobacteria bacterium]